jgi:beta-lactamase regulating signal transducer with metallopeptidase domain
MANSGEIMKCNLQLCLMLILYVLLEETVFNIWQCRPSTVLWLTTMLEQSIQYYNVLFNEESLMLSRTEFHTEDEA